VRGPDHRGGPGVSGPDHRGGHGQYRRGQPRASHASCALVRVHCSCVESSQPQPEAANRHTRQSSEGGQTGARAPPRYYRVGPPAVSRQGSPAASRQGPPAVLRRPPAVPPSAARAPLAAAAAAAAAALGAAGGSAEGSAASASHARRRARRWPDEQHGLGRPTGGEI